MKRTLNYTRDCRRLTTGHYNRQRQNYGTQRRRCVYGVADRQKIILELGRKTSSRRQSSAASGVSSGGTLTVDMTDVKARVNLRRVMRGSDVTLQAIGQPLLTTSVAGHSQVAGGLFHTPSGRVCQIVYARGALIAVSDMTARTIVAMDAPPKFVLPVSGGSGIIVMPSDDNGPARLFMLDETTDTWTDGGLYPALPAITLVREEMEHCSVDIPGFRLAGSYGVTSRSLSESDVRSIGSAISTAYHWLTGHATARGLYVQPVVARYRLRSAEGEVLYTSAPMVMSASPGLQATKVEVTLTGDGMAQASFSPLAATLYSVGHTFSSPLPDLWQRLLKGVEIIVTPQLHPFDSSLPSQSRYAAGEATRLTFTASLPGTDRDGRSPLPSRAAIALIDLEDDSSLWLDRIAASRLGVDECLSRLKAAMRRDLPQPDGTQKLLRRLSPPHTFTAACGATSGDLTVWGNLTVTRFQGYSPAEMVTGRPQPEWTPCPMAAAVTMADGEVMVKSLTVSDTQFISLSPLLVYPSPDAVAMKIVIGRKVVEVALRPSPSGRFAYWISDDLAPLTPGDSLPAFLLPSSHNVGVKMPGAMVMCRAETPLQPLTASQGDGAAIIALHALPHHSNSFNWAEPRFYALGSGGVYSLAPAGGRTSLRVTRLDSRPLRSASLATGIPGGMAAVIGNSLVAFIGNTSRQLIDECGEVTALGWLQAHNELLLTRSDTAEALVTDLTGLDRWTRTMPSAGAAIISEGDTARLSADTGMIFDLNCESRQGAATVELTARSEPFDPEPGTLASLHLPLAGRDIKGEVRLTASHLSAESTEGLHPDEATLFALTFSGQSNPVHPLEESFILPHCHQLTLHVALRGSLITIGG